jgi:integrase
MDELFAIDARARERGLNHPERDIVRQQRARPPLEQIKASIETARLDTLPKSALAKACNYTLTLWQRLTRFLDYPVLEITSLDQTQFSFGTKSFVQFNGKGRKERSVPLWSTTAKALKAWFSELSGRSQSVAFPNARGSSLTRDGVNYILQQVAERAVASCPSLSSKHVSPHLLRHTCAFHLLQSGVDIAVIALWLGHENIQTTHGYIEADLLH